MIPFTTDLPTLVALASAALLAQEPVRLVLPAAWRHLVVGLQLGNVLRSAVIAAAHALGDCVAGHRCGEHREHCGSARRRQ